MDNDISPQGWLHSLKGTLGIRAAKVKAMLFVLIVCLSMVGMGAWSIWKGRKTDLHDATTATTNMTRALAQHADDTIRAADSILLGLVERLETDGMADATLPRMKKLLQLSVSGLPSLNGIFVYDQDGNWIVNSQNTLLKNANNADREYFQYHLANLDQSAHVGVPVQSRSTRRWIIPVSRRLNHPDGTFAGVVLATIEMDYFRQFHESFDIGKSGTIFLALDNGTLIVRRPFIAEVIGKDISAGPVFMQLRATGPGTTMLTARLDQVERLYSYRHITHYPLVVAMALSKEDILANWRQEAYRTAAVIIFLIAVLSGIGIRLVRQISVRERAEHAVRVAKRELEQVNQALEMLSLEDSLTGLGNRRKFDLSLIDECKQGARYQTSLALIMIDVDHFKRYNDLYGHPAGDECLRRVGAAVILARGRASDVATRYGGEEIAVLLAQTTTEGAMAAAERIRHCVEALAIAHAGNPAGHVTISVGVAALVPLNQNEAATRLVAAADRALYAAKAGGRNQVRQAEQCEDAVDVVVAAGSE